MGKRATARSVTTFVFRVRNLPAALYKALGGFATNGGQHDQARELYGWQQFSSPRNSMPTSKAIPDEQFAGCFALEELPSSPTSGAVSAANYTIWPLRSAGR